MNTTVIYIGDEKLDLFPDTVIAQTMKRMDVGDLTTRFASYTNAFKVPITPNNNRIYQYSNNLSSSTSVPYEKQYTKIVQNGIEVVRDGIHYIRKVSTYYEVYIISGTRDFFDVIGEKKLTDLQDHPSITGVDLNNGDLRNNTTGVCDAVMNQGDFYIESGRYHLNELNTYLRSMYYHTIIDRIISDAGYSKSGSIFSNNKYLNMAVLCCGSSSDGVRYDDKTFFDNRVEAVNDVGITTNGVATIPMPFQTVLLNNSGAWDGAVGRYNVSHPFVASGKEIFRLRYLITITVDSFSSAGTFRLGISRNGAAPSVLEYVDISSPGTYVLNLEETGAQIQARVGQYHQIQLVPISGTPVAYISYGKLIAYVTPFVSGGTGAATFFNRLLPPTVLQRDIVKHFLVSFGLLIFEENGLLIFKGIDEIISDKANAKDWTNKRDVSDIGEITFTPLDYAQNNYFRYSNADDVDENEGEGILSIANDNAPIEKEIYRTQFSAGGMVQIGDIFMLSVPVYELGVDIGLSMFQFEPGIRIFLIRDKYAFEPSVEFSFGIPESSYRVAYFNDPEQSDSMRWQHFIDQNYAQIGLSLQKAKLVTWRYLLNEVDAVDMNFRVPLFDSESYFIVNGIKNFVSGKTTQVELLKII